MLGGLCDSLVAFLFDVAWSRVVADPSVSDEDTYEVKADFNDYLDSEYGQVEIAGAVFEPSYVLFRLDETAYDAAYLDWEAEQSAEAASEKEVAA